MEKRIVKIEIGNCYQCKYCHPRADEYVGCNQDGTYNLLKYDCLLEQFPKDCPLEVVKEKD